MKHKLINFLLAATLLTTVSCADEDWRQDGGGNADPIEIGEITVSEAPESRSHDNSDNWMWVPNEKIIVTAASADGSELGKATYSRNLTNDAWISDAPLSASVKKTGTVYTIATVLPSADEKQAQDDAYNYVLTDYVMATGAEVSFDDTGKLTASLKHQTVDVVAIVTKGNDWYSDDAFYEALSGCAATFYSASDGDYTVKAFPVAGNDKTVDYNDNATDEDGTPVGLAPGKKTYIFRAHLDAGQLAGTNGASTDLLQLAGLSGTTLTGSYTRPTGIENGKRLKVIFPLDAPVTRNARSAVSEEKEGERALESSEAVVEPWLGKRVIYRGATSWIGDGSEDNPYQVDSKEKLIAIGENMESLAKHYKLMNDIDLNDAEWTPIGSGSGSGNDNDNNPFSGSLDGNGYTISGLNVNITTTVDAGLFYGIDENGFVQNLGVTGRNGVTGKNNAGGIAGSNSGTIQNCYTTGAITCEASRAGGIAGNNANAEKATLIQYCYATGDISGNKAGGICNLGMGGQAKNSIALNSAITGTGDSPSTGRIAGYVGWGVLTDNYASPLIPGTWENKGLIASDGEDLTEANFLVQEATDAFAGWPTEVWKLDTDNLPSLKDFTLPQPADGITRAEVMPPTLSITSDVDLATFRKAVTDGNNYKGATVTLAKDITVNGWDTSIGNDNTLFLGTFDGQGHVITLTGNQSIFGYIGPEGIVKNLGVKAAIVNETTPTGGIAGNNVGTIQCCYVEGKIRGNSTGYVSCGGIAGNNAGTIEDCYSTASIDANTPGGIAGENLGTVQRCYATGAINGSNACGGIVCYHNGDYIKNCIALNASISGNGRMGRITASGSSDPSNNYASPIIPGEWTDRGVDEQNGADLTADNFTTVTTATGAFTDWSTNVWTLDTDNLPSLKAFTLSQPADGITRAEVMPGPPIFSITSDVDLATFRKTVADGNDYEGATVTLANDITVSGWDKGIGTFLGTFDGQGHVITLTGSDQLFGTLGKYGSAAAATIQNLGVKVEIDNAKEDLIGGIVRYNRGTIRECYTEGTITNNSRYGYAGGIAGQNFGTVRDCYSTVSITVPDGAGGIVQNNQSGGTIERCYATGTISAGGGDTGGIVGNQTYNSTVKNCIALNDSITGDGVRNRIANNSNGLSGNYASPFILDGGWSHVGADNLDGEDLTEDNFLDQGAGAGAFKGWNETTWDFGDKSGLPKLKTIELATNVIISGQGDDDGKMPARSSFLTFSISIGNKADLIKFRDAVNGDQDYQGETVILQADIDLSGEEWIPIGTSSSPFKGTFDGNYHVIRNMKVNTTGDYAGLFAVVQGEVKCLGVTGTVNSTGWLAGGIVGALSYDAKITDCFADVDVECTQNAGGIVGDGETASVVISNCYSTGNVSGGIMSGGINGRTSSCTITNCYATGSVTGREAGGISNLSSMNNCVALNLSGVYGESTGGRVTSASGIGSNCYSSPLIPLNADADKGNDGTLLTWANYKNAMSGWSSSSWNNLRNSAKLPTLKGFGTNQPAALLRWVSFLPDK